MEDYFTATQVHCEGSSDLDIDSYGNLFTIGCDDLIYHKNLITAEEERIDIDAPEGAYSAIAVHPIDQEVLAIGGLNKKVEILKQKKQQDALMIYNALGPVYYLKFSYSGKYLVAATEEQTAIIYSYEKKKFIKCRPGHGGSVLSVFFSHDDQFVCTSGTDGTLKIYKIQGLDNKFEVTLMYSLSISSQIKQESTQRLIGAFNMKGNIIAAPGKPTLRIIEVNGGGSFKSTMSSNLKHDKDITICYWHSDEIIITGGLDETVNIWNFHNSQKIAFIPQISFTKIVKYEDIFIGINNSGNYYEFKKPQLLQIHAKQAQRKVSEIEISADPESLQEKEQEDQDVQELAEKTKKTKSKAQKLIVSYPQLAITKCTQFFRNNRFLLYNEIGCIIERIDSESRSIELQYHDATVINKRKILFKNRQMKYFQLQLLRIAYANDNQFGFYGEASWQYEMPEIQGITMGSQWLAVVNQEAIRIFDFGGNQLQNICIDRPYVAMSGYENLLAIVYHDAIPMWGCNSLRMKIYQINDEHNKFINQVAVPLKPGSNLKNFGFSTEGMIYSEDTKGKIRVYLFDKNQWLLVYDPETGEDNAPKLWLVGISNYQLLAFKLPEGQLEPTVLPRSILRKIKIELTTVNKQQFYKNADSLVTLGDLMWRQHTIAHERFRHSNWFKYRWARDKSNPYFALSKNVPTEADIEKTEKGFDQELVILIEHMIKSGEVYKAFETCKSFVKNKEVGQKIVQIFDQINQHEYAHRLENYFNQKIKQTQYELTRNFNLEIRSTIERSVNIKPIDPMQRKGRPTQKPAFQQQKHPKSTISDKGSILKPDVIKKQELVFNPFKDPKGLKKPLQTDPKKLMIAKKQL